MNSIEFHHHAPGYHLVLDPSIQGLDRLLVPVDELGHMLHGLDVPTDPIVHLKKI